ncbi:MAG: tetratricopeptide repeat protein [Bacteroidia bacterium]
MILNFFRRAILLLIAASLLSLSGCAALKGSKVDKAWQNVNAKFNGYFNARQLYSATEQNLNQNQEDDFSRILPVYKYGKEEDAKAAASNLDLVITKASSVIDKRPLSNYLDNSYFLIGKSYFLKQDYYAGIEIFQYVVSKYKRTELAYRSTLWIAKSYMELDQPEEAQAILSLVRSEKRYPEDVKMERDLTMAAINIDIGNYNSAIKPLQDAIPKVKKKQPKLRYKFILAQLLENAGKTDSANLLYREIIRKNPPYEIAFNARVNLARSVDVKSIAEANQVKKLLLKMLKDDKNIQFLDQIYFELGNLAMRQGNKEEAIGFYSQSARASTDNQNQKTLSYLTLADIYFKDKEFRFAKAYYDSASLTITEEYPDHEQVKLKKEVLDELVTNLLVVEREDSLQHLAGLSEEDLSEYIDSLIQARKLEKERLEALGEEESDYRSSGIPEFDDPINPLQGSEAGSSGFPLYNPSAMAVGYNEFQRKWGPRPLEDNWRRSKKAATMTTIEEEEDTVEATEDLASREGVDAEILENIPKEQQQYYLDIPLNPVQMNASDNRITESLFTVGNIYFEQLKDYEQAILVYNDLLERYPENRYALDVYYNLYKLYVETGDEQNANKYKKIIIDKFPESQYAMLLENPDAFMREFGSSNKDEELEADYQRAYDVYKLGDCDQLNKMAMAANAKYSLNYLKPKYDYLEVLCKGKSQDEEEFISNLQGIVDQYQNDRVSDHAQNVIRYLKAQGDTASASVSAIGSEGETDPGVYADNNKGNFYYMVSFPIEGGNIENIKSRFSDYNSKYFKIASLQVNSFLLDRETQVLLVKQFSNRDKAEKYFTGVTNDAEFRKSLKINSPEDFIISEANFKEVIKTKDLNSYLKFFRNQFKL